MFQTEPILFLQQLGGPFATDLLALVSALGTRDVYFFVFIVVAFGYDLRKGWIVGQALLWTTGLTIGGKELFALPRPHDVDSRVFDPILGRPTQEAFMARGAARFLGSLPGDVVAFYRSGTGIAWGLPSGHTSVFSALCGSLALAGERRRWWIALLAGGSIMALSRMYLGLHFLADVLAGLLLGGAVLVALDSAFGRSESWLNVSVERASRQLAEVPFALWLWLAPAVFLPLSLNGEAQVSPMLWGLNLGIWQSARAGRLAGATGGLRRCLRAALALGVGWILHIGLEISRSFSLLERSPLIDALSSFLELWLLVVVSVALARRLRLQG